SAPSARTAPTGISGQAAVSIDSAAPNRTPAADASSISTVAEHSPSLPASAPKMPEPIQASIASSMQIVVGRNDTLDRIFRRLSLDVSDLEAIRNLPGIRQSLDFLKPGDA